MTKEYERLRMTSAETKHNALTPNENNLVMTLLNIRSLRKHYQDLKLDSNAMACDLLLLTETQLYRDEPTSHIEEALRPFSIYWQPQLLNFNSLAVLFSTDTRCTSRQYIPSINGLLLCAQKQHFKPITVLLIYRNHHNHPNQFLFHLREILLTNTVHIALGDFNIDFLTHDSNNLKQLMEGFNMHQLISQPTCIPGASLLDHVYVTLPFLPIQNIQAVTKSVYYSDHEAVKVAIMNL